MPAFISALMIFTTCKRLGPVQVRRSKYSLLLLLLLHDKLHNWNPRSRVVIAGVVGNTAIHCMYDCMYRCGETVAYTTF